jgi:aldose 1-epimerase
MFTLKTNFATLNIDLNQGGKILFLELNSIVIIQADLEEDFYLSGSYLLFPWVNRISSPTIKLPQKEIQLANYKTDQNGLPIHGLYAQSPRKIISQTTNSITISPFSFYPDFPTFRETFILQENEFICQTEFYNPTKLIQAFGYGYHPYFQLNKPIDELELIVEPDTWIPLDKNLLPAIEIKKTLEVLPSPSLSQRSLDHLFLETRPQDAKITLKDPSSNLSISCIGKHAQGLEEISLPFFQIYTPPHRKTIAIEPQTHSGNMFEYPNFHPIYLEPNSYKRGEWKIQLSI